MGFLFCKTCGSNRGSNPSTRFWGRSSGDGEEMAGLAGVEERES